MGDFFTIDWSFMDQLSANPFAGMWFLFLNGGWVILLIIALWGALELWKEWRQGLYAKKRTFIVLGVNIPRLHEQGPRAVDNMFAYIAGAHSSVSFKEKWLDGKTQDTLSFEIISLNGQVNFMVRTVRGLRDLVEAAVYSQYPDAEVVEVNDYTSTVPKHFPDEEWDMWGTEMIPVRPDIYPLKTYPMFEDSVSGEFKDPLSAMLESMSRLGQDEQAWFQITLVPIAQGDFGKTVAAAVKKMKGEKVEVKKTWLDTFLNMPITLLTWLVEGFFGAGEHAAPPKKEAPPMSKIMGMTQMEKDVIGAIENKSSKIAYLAKLRFAYYAKKTIMNKARIVNPFIGALKQLNGNHLQSLKPESKKVGVNGALWWFKAQRNDARKSKLTSAMRSRDWWYGTGAFHLCTEELATLWHFPHSIQVKSPQLQKTESKKTEPPTNLPFG